MRPCYTNCHNKGVQAPCKTVSIFDSFWTFSDCSWLDFFERLYLPYLSWNFSETFHRIGAHSFISAPLDSAIRKVLPCSSYNLFMLIFLWFMACSASNGKEGRYTKVIYFLRFVFLLSVRVLAGQACFWCWHFWVVPYDLFKQRRRFSVRYVFWIK